MTLTCYLLALALLVTLPASSQQEGIPPYVKQCKKNDPKLEECLIGSLHHLRPYLVNGISEIKLPSVEPFILDSLSLSLTGGEQGYKITLRDIHMYGASNFTVSKIKLSKNGQPFEAKFHIPEMKIDANYTSSGVLIILPASGGGTFHAALGNVAATMRGFVSSSNKNGKDYLHIDKLDIDLAIKNVRMRVEKVFNNNRILTEATNLFLRENGHEVINVMMPQLRVKLAGVIKKVLNQLLLHTPTQLIVVP